MPIRALTLAVLVALAAPVTAQAARAADEAGAGDITVSAAWTRQTPPGAKVAGGYLTLTNKGTEPDRLIGGMAAFAGRVEIHEMAVTDGVMRMAPVEGGLVVPPGGTVVLKPGGFHVMFMDLRESPQEGDTVPVTLTFERAGDILVEMPVAAIGAPSPDRGKTDQGKMSHGTMDHGAASDR